MKQKKQNAGSHPVEITGDHDSEAFRRENRPPPHEIGSSPDVVAAPQRENKVRAEKRRYVVHMWECDSWAIRDTHRNRIVGWRSNVVRAEKRSAELNQDYTKL